MDVCIYINVLYVNTFYTPHTTHTHTSTHTHTHQQSGGEGLKNGCLHI
jgi:hypothetical protein